MFRLSILGSGSSGNSALLETDGACLLIDAGLSARRTTQRLAELGVTLADLDGILLTHEHGDHTLALGGLRKAEGLTVFATEGTMRAVRPETATCLQWRVFESRSSFRIADLEIESFPVPHDAQEPVGFVLAHGVGDLLSPRRELAWITDLGHVPDWVRTRIQKVDILALESNYCPDLLERDTRRPWPLRQRISGRHGHLSNRAARELLDEVDGPGWRHVFFTHLSRDCNTPEVAGAALSGAKCFARRCSYSIAGVDGLPGWHDFS